MRCQVPEMGKRETENDPVGYHLIDIQGEGLTTLQAHQSNRRPDFRLLSLTNMFISTNITAFQTISVPANPQH